jgi:hypothetical protein
MLRPVLRQILPERFKLSSFSRSAQRDTPQHHGTLVTIGSYPTKKRRGTDELALTTFDNDENGSQKALHMAPSRRMSSDDGRADNGITVRRSFELVGFPADGAIRR